MHLLKYTEWEQNGKWHTGDCSSLAKGSNYWWRPAKMLNMELTDYILMLRDKFHAINFRYNYDHNVLLFDWPSYKDCHTFTLFINKIAREKKYFIE